MKKEHFIYGKQSVSLLLKQHPKMILELRAYQPQQWDHLVKASRLPIKIRQSSMEDLKQITGEEFNHQGIVAFVEAYPYFGFPQLLELVAKREKDLILMLDKIQDPQNFGAIIRSALLLGVKNIIIADRHQVAVNSTVIKASAGAAYLLNITIVTNLNQTVSQLKKRGYWVYSSNLKQKAIDSRQLDFADKSVLIVGNEHRGVSRLLTENSDVNLFIPTTQIIDSLNVANATAILLFQMSSQLGLI